MTLTADIRYKSNGQLAALKGVYRYTMRYVLEKPGLISYVTAKRRNKWICALKTALAELNIYGPKGNPNSPPGTTRYTKVPYEEIKAKEQQKVAEGAALTPGLPPQGWHLSGNNAAIGTSNSPQVSLRERNLTIIHLHL